MENTIESILKEYERINFEYQRKQIEGEEFNVFHLIDDIYGIGETKHSRFLAFILNPKGTHGKGNLFLKLFLEKLKIEFNENETWEVFAEKGYADVLLKCKYPKKCIVIENKSNEAVDQTNQLYRYWYNHILTNVEEIDSENPEKCRIIYLPEGKWKKYDLQSITKPNDWNPILPPKLDDKIIEHWSFLDEIREWLVECCSHDISYRIRCFIEDYIKFWDDTKLKDEFYMNELEKYFKEKETGWIDFVEASNYIQEIKNSWIEKFSEELNKLKIENWNYINYRNQHRTDDYFINLKFNDFRWYLSDCTNLCFIYEFHSGLTIWKNIFGSHKNDFKDEFNNIFTDDFDFIENDENYVMKLKENLNSEIIFEVVEESRLTWIAGNESHKILNIVLPILNKYMQRKDVIDFFNKVDNHQKI